jgi:DNA polymerase III subunit gamma/tau
MSYQVIARKWRPQTFEEVTGQEAITRTLRNAVAHERLHHAYIFSGARGVGKTTTARLLAKALNCQKTDKPNPLPCSFNDPNACDSCKSIAEGKAMFVQEIDAATHTGVDNVRDVIIDSALNNPPSQVRFRIFIIDEVHMLSNASFNALLKTLEEPPPWAVFIMATTELHKVPDTILSRCQEFEFRTIPVAKIFERLKTIAVSEKINITDDGLREIARSGEGSMRDAQSNFDQVISFSGEQIGTEDVITALGLASSEMLIRIIKAIAENNAREALAVVEDLIRRGQDLRNFCRDLLSFLRDLLVAKIAGDAENLLESASISREELKTHAENFLESDLVRFFNSLSDTADQLRNATQERYILEIGLIKLIEMRRVTPIEKLLERLAKLESALGSGNLAATTTQTQDVLPSPQASPPSSFAPPVEKKTPIVEFSREEVPFEVGEKPSVIFAPKIEVNETVITAPKIEVSETIVVAPKAEARDSPPEFPPFEPQDFEPPVQNFPEPPPVAKFQVLNDDFLNSVSVKLPPISSEELEHIEDNWLDNAYEEKLKREGDNLMIIAAATEIIVKALGATSNNSAPQSFQSSNGAATAPARTQTKPIFVPPDFEAEDGPGEIIELSENPTEEELMRFAENHPLVKRALRIFRGKIVNVTRDK